VRHLKHRYKDNHVEREDTAPREVLPFPKAPSTWAERDWDRLLRACHKLGSDDLPDLALSKMIQRAELLRDLTRDKQRPRHLMEIQNGKSRSNPVNRPACPSKPMTKANEIPSRLCARIENLYTEKTALVRDATEIFVHHLEEREWVFEHFPPRLCRRLNAPKVAKRDCRAPSAYPRSWDIRRYPM
jgi:hypothetical protein